MTDCREKCFSKDHILCAHFIRGHTLEQMHMKCAFAAKRFKENVFSSLLYIDDIEGIENEQD